MAGARIVTDSAAELDVEEAAALGVTVLPLRIKLGNEILVDGPELDCAAFHQRLMKGGRSNGGLATPVVLPPSPQEFIETYGALAREPGDIVSIHIASGLNRTVQVANQARTTFLGRARVAVIDSEFATEAQGVLVREAARAGRDGATGAQVVRLLRGLMARTYLTFYPDSDDFLQRAGLMPANYEDYTTAEFRPLLMLEGGEMTPLRRQRTKGTPVERLCEFAAEFMDLKELAVLYTDRNEMAEDLLALLQEQFSQHNVVARVYGPVFGSLVGPRALGIVAFSS